MHLEQTVEHLLLRLELEVLVAETTLNVEELQLERHFIKEGDEQREVHSAVLLATPEDFLAQTVLVEHVLARIVSFVDHVLNQLSNLHLVSPDLDEVFVEHWLAFGLLFLQESFAGLP